MNVANVSGCAVTVAMQCHARMLNLCPELERNIYSLSRTLFSVWQTNDWGELLGDYIFVSGRSRVTRCGIYVVLFVRLKKFI